MIPSPDALPDRTANQYRLREIATGYFLPRALHVAAELDLADILAAGPMDLVPLAAATHADAMSLHRLLRALVSAGVFEEVAPGRFASNALSTLLRDDVPGSARAFVRYLGDECNWRSWEQLLYSIESGKPAFEELYGTTSFQHLAAHPDKAALFDAAMVSSSELLNAALIAGYDFSPYRSIVDVGGGVGSTLCSILDAYPDAHGTVFDLEEVAARAERYIKERGCAERCLSAGGSFFDSVPAGGDAYFMKHVLHDWSDEHCLRILHTCHEAMPPSAKLLICERIVDAGDQGSAVKLMDLYMLVKTQGGRERTRDEYSQLLARTGFTLQRVVATPSPWCVLEANKAR